MNPLLLTAITEAIVKVNKARMTPFQAEASAKDVVEALKTNPVVVNATNSESPLQSRVVVGSGLAMVGGAFIAAGDLLAMFKTGGFDPERAAADLAVLLGAGTALYGRLRTGLKPLFTKKG